MARGQRDPVLEQQWRERMARWQASGLNVREFCVQHALIESSFYYWKRELRAREEASASGLMQKPSSRRTAALRPTAQSTAAKQSSSKFVPVTVLPSTTMAVEVRCPSGHVVCLSACDVALLVSLFAALNPPASGEPSC